MYEDLPQKAPPAFPVAEPHMFCDYGFDPEIDYFQLQQRVIEEQQRRKRGSSKREARKAAAEAVRFKLQKPISKDHQYSSGVNKGKKRAKWWKNCIQFLKNKWGAAARTTSGGDNSYSTTANELRICYEEPAAAIATATATATAEPLPAAPSPLSHPQPPLYTADGSSQLYLAPCRTTRRTFGSWPWSPLKVAEMMPYHSLKDLGLFDDDNGGKDHTDHRISGTPSSHMPIYLVT